MLQYIVDRAGPLTNKRRTATGGYLVDATLARVGVMDYPERGQRHYNSPEVLESNLEAVMTCAVTNRHPRAMVTPATYQDVNCGHVVGKAEFRDGMIFATLAIQDEELIADIESGAAREVSMGYLSHVEPASGEYEGEAYDMARTNIEWNHIAVVPAGRAGKDVCLCLDSADIPNGDNVMKFKVNGKEYTADGVQAGIEALEMLFGNAQGQVTELQASVTKLEGELATAKSQATIDAAVAAELEKRETERKGAERKAAVQKKYPKMVLDGKTQETIDALFETIETEDADLAAAAPGAKSGAASAERQENKDAAVKPVRPSARAKMLEAQRKVSASPVKEGE